MERFSRPEERVEELQLEEYVKLVENLEADAFGESGEKEPLNSVSSDVPEVMILTEENTTLVDKFERFEERRIPLYKDLLLSARKRDSRLSALDFEVKLAERKISEFRIKITEEPKEVVLYFLNFVLVKFCRP